MLDVDPASSSSCTARLSSAHELVAADESDQREELDVGPANCAVSLWKAEGLLIVDETVVAKSSVSTPPTALRASGGPRSL